MRPSIRWALCDRINKVSISQAKNKSPITEDNLLQVQVVEEELSSNNSQEEQWRNVGLELLVNLSKSGEVDPWDVDLIYVIDKFLKQIERDNLQEVGDIIFFVSVLFRLKSEKVYNQTLEAEEEEYIDHDDLIDFEQLEFSEVKKIQPKDLDNILIRNPQSIKQKRKRKITLNDLFKVFKTIEKPRKQRRSKKLNIEDFEHEDDIIMREDEDVDALDIAHEENLEEKIQKLSKYILKILPLNQEILLEELRDYMGHSIDTFLSALFLSHSGKTEIIQEEFYKALRIKRIL